MVYYQGFQRFSISSTKSSDTGMPELGLNNFVSSIATSNGFTYSSLIILMTLVTRHSEYGISEGRHGLWSSEAMILYCLAAQTYSGTTSGLLHCRMKMI